MPHPSHRIDIVVVPQQLERPLSDGAAEELLAALGVNEQGFPEEPDRIVSGGCRRVWFDRPGRLWLYGNLVGGFRVYCPTTAEVVSSDFGRAFREWKAGAERALSCPSCGFVHALEDFNFGPPAAFAHWALIISDAKHLELTPRSLDVVEQHLGAIKTLHRRT